MKKSELKKYALSAMFLAIGLVLPLLTGQIPKFGKMLLPMHIPVILCGMICGWEKGFIVGLILPLLRSVIFGVPTLYPDAVSMTFELAAYGAVSGFIYSRFPTQTLKSIYASLLGAMISGRIAMAVAKIILLSISANGYTFAAFLSGALINAAPGLVIQLILIPLIMVALYKAKLIPLSDDTKKSTER